MLTEEARHQPVAWAVPAAAGAMREDDDPTRTRWHGEIALEQHLARWDLYKLAVVARG
jgi:hypothetical protein